MQGGRVFGETTGQNWAFRCEGGVLALQAAGDKNLSYVQMPQIPIPYKFRHSIHTGFMPMYILGSTLKKYQLC